MTVRFHQVNSYVHQNETTYGIRVATKDLTLLDIRSKHRKGSRERLSCNGTARNYLQIFGTDSFDLTTDKQQKYINNGGNEKVET